MQGLFCMRPEISEAVGGRRTVESFGFSFVDLTGGSAAPLDVVDPSFSFLTELPGTRLLLLRDSCNRLVLFEHRREHRGGRMGYVVCNPTTKEWEAVPACGDPELPLTYAYLAFDPAVSAHFHLVQFQVEEDEEFVSVHAYSSETKTWGGNQINEGWRQVTTFLIAHPHSRCPFINGFLHLLVLDQDQMKIAVVDVQGRARGMIPVPPGHQWMCYFGESQGQLHYMSQEILDDDEGKYNLSVWALEDYDA
jgi:hypothetical protein